MYRLYKKELELMLSKIKEYDRIIIFRHTSPDFDAYGTQFGMYYFLKENFPEKEIYTLGTTNAPVGVNLYPDNDILSDEFLKEKPFLTIVVDTGNTKRISDERYAWGDYIIKIDHHPNVEPYGDLNIVRDSASAASELVYHIFKSKTFASYKINDDCAKYLFSGVAGDTSKFTNSGTTKESFLMAADMLKYNFNMNTDVYLPMFDKPISDFENIKEVLNCYKISPKGVAYYYLDEAALKKLNIDVDEAKMYLYLFNSCSQIKVWCSFAYDSRVNNIRGSLRSRNIKVNHIAAKYRGGGHDFACGCRLESVDEIDSVIRDIEKEL